LGAAINIKLNMKHKNWSRKKIHDGFTGMLKADGTPMSRQQIHMARKKARGLCLTCGAPALGVYCLKHTVAARERMRRKLKYRRRLRQSPSYILEQNVRSKRRLPRVRSEQVQRLRSRGKGKAVAG
jgi:hypothetical protein